MLQNLCLYCRFCLNLSPFGMCSFAELRLLAWLAWFLSQSSCLLCQLAQVRISLAYVWLMPFARLLAWVRSILQIWRYLSCGQKVFRNWQYFLRFSRKGSEIKHSLAANSAVGQQDLVSTKQNQRLRRSTFPILPLTTSLRCLRLLHPLSCGSCQLRCGPAWQDRHSDSGWWPAGAAGGRRRFATGSCMAASGSGRQLGLPAAAAAGAPRPGSRGSLWTTKSLHKPVVVWLAGMQTEWLGTGQAGMGLITCQKYAIISRHMDYMQFALICRNMREICRKFIKYAYIYIIYYIYEKQICK